ncbi:MAG TPA: hypothetical protein VGR35_12035 [Tepidisphaeraceae bacterium]|nr:hypothetical protein [Tepidisphaeraceae bacterium]
MSSRKTSKTKATKWRTERWINRQCRVAEVPTTSYWVTVPKEQAGLVQLFLIFEGGYKTSLSPLTDADADTSVLLVENCDETAEELQAMLDNATAAKPQKGRRR